jgi:rhamnulokinase
VSESTHLAVDLGAESGRAVAATFDGERIDTREVSRFPNRPVQLPDGLRWDVLHLHDQVLSALHATRPRSVGIDSWAVDFGFLDADGALIGNPLHHRDGRGRAGMELALRRVSREDIYAATGIQFMPINTAFQLVALEGSVAREHAHTLLLVPDLIGYWLTGEKRAEATNASTTQLLDVRTGDWAHALLDRLAIPASLLPPVLEPGSVLGETHRATVVAVASHDTASAVVGTPLGAHAAYISSGTWSLVGVERDAPVLGPGALAANLTNERGFGRTIRLLKNVMGLWLVQDCRRVWGVAGYEELVALAAAAPPEGPLFNPDDPTLLAPADMPAAIRALCGAGDRGELLRAIFESLACKYRVVLDELECTSAQRIDTVHVVGGGARNELLCQLTAEVCERPVLAGPVEAATLGNALVQLHALGEVGGLAEMRELVRRSTAFTAYEPGALPGDWAARLERFRALVE